MDNKKYEMNKRLEEAVNKGDIEEVSKILDDVKLDICFDEPKKFADKIRQIEKGDIKIMKKKFKLSKVGVIAAAIVAISCVSVSAAYVFNTYMMEKGDRYYSVTSNEELSDDAVEKMVDEAHEYEENINTENVTTPEYDNFDNIEAAEKNYNMKILKPEIMPKLDLDSITGNQFFVDENSSTSTVWLSYVGENEKSFGITVTKNELSEDTTSVSSGDIDEGSLNSYKSAKGFDFNVFNESSDDKTKTAKVALANVGKYEYAMVFVGFEESEVTKTIDSLDLSEYR